ncbi:hypothetical protein EB796_002266 [Bugula neritina]|uniref:TIR domain-containing protein n=1 Tax=Bugula neritina TaxID=10212 RepID=A0A7J7KMP9_BUGNE|nr:hypothetical protein EB796_002266 [Bugula neritina]
MHTSLSIVDAMTKAVDNAAVVIPVLIAKYHTSANCRKELEYADKQGKPIVPIGLQRDYIPKEWLSFVLGNNFWHDLYQDPLYSSKLEAFLEVVHAHASSARV